MLEHRQADAVVAHVRGEPQTLVGFDGVGAGILQFVSANLVQQADTTAFLAQIEQHAAALVGNRAQCRFELEAAVTAQAEQRIAGQALGVQTTQHRLAVGHVAERQRDMFLASVLVEKTMHGEHAERRRQLGSGDEHDRHERKSQEAEKRTL